MANFYLDNKDLQFYVEKAIDWEPLVRLTEYEYQAEDGYENSFEAVESYKPIFEMIGEIAAEEIAPEAKEIDRQGVTFSNGEVRQPAALDALFKKFAELDLHKMCLPRELGGMNTPMMLYYVNSELIGRADVSIMAHFGFHGGMAMAMLMYSLIEGTTEYQMEPAKLLKTRFQKEIAEIASGNAWGSMDITEPHAGSDMGALSCMGEQDKDGNWFLTGSKILITSGHGKYHFVIARTEKNDGDSFDGLMGLSLFLVPAYEEDEAGNKKWLAPLGGIEEKLGHHGSATCTVNFDRTPAQLIGKRGEGFRLMLLLMNNARIGVGFESLGLCEAAWRLAKEYAASRPSMGKTIDRHEMIADYLEEMETDIQSIRALAMYSAFHEEMAQKLRIKLLVLPVADEADRKDTERLQAYHQRLARATTPLLKYFAAEKAVEMARRSIQIHGGGGYIKEYGAEKLLRDAIVFPIYEGTSQIQALMAMKDNLMGVLKRPQEFVTALATATTKSYISRNPLERRVAGIQANCLGVIKHLMTKTAVGKAWDTYQKPFAEWIGSFTKNWDPKRDFSYAMLHAERLTLMLAYKAMAEILFEQAQKFSEREDLLVRFLERAEPKVEYLYKVITGSGDRLVKKLQVAPSEN